MTTAHIAVKGEGYPETIRFRNGQSRVKHSLMELSFAQLQKIADEFDLGRIVRMEEPLTTQCNITDPFRTGRGTFLVRIRHGEEFGERVEFIHAAMKYLQSKGVPVPEVMKHVRGRTWTLWGDRIVEVYRYISHDPGVHRDWVRMNAAAVVLTDLHRHLRDLNLDRPPVPPEMRNDITPKECWDMLMPLEAAMKKEYGVTATRIVDQGFEILEKIRGSIVELMDDYERIAGSLPWIFVHGDYHFWNVLYHGDDVVGVVDFDFMQERERIFDLAYALQGVVNHLYIMGGGGYLQPDQFERLPWVNVRIWLDQYEQNAHIPLVKQEKARLALEVLRVFLVNLIVTANQGNPSETLVQYADQLRYYQWIARTPGTFQTFY